jgi:hypothetical protein
VLVVFATEKNLKYLRPRLIDGYLKQDQSCVVATLLTWFFKVIFLAFVTIKELGYLWVRLQEAYP